MQQIHFDDVIDGRVVLNTIFLKRLRQKRGLSQDALARLCLDSHLALSLASIKRAEAGKSVSYRTARHLAGIYHTDLDLLIAPTAGGDPGLQTWAATTNCENLPVARVHMLERRRVTPAVSVIFFTLKSDELNASAQKHVLDAGARTIADPNGTELAVVFGAPAHRCTDAFAALRCAINLKSCAAQSASLVLRRRAVAEVFAYTANVNANLNHAAIDSSIYLETDLATQLSVHAQFEARNIPIPGCRRFLRLNSSRQGMQFPDSR